MKQHPFEPGDKVIDKNTKEIGVVVRVNDTEVIVKWVDLPCAWDTDPRVLNFWKQ